MKKITLMISLLMLSLSITACTQVTREDVGMVGGGVAGGVIGSAVTRSTTGAVVGAVGGAVAGRAIARETR